MAHSILFIAVSFHFQIRQSSPIAVSNIIILCNNGTLPPLPYRRLAYSFPFPGQIVSNSNYRLHWPASCLPPVCVCDALIDYNYFTVAIEKKFLGGGPGRTHVKSAQFMCVLCQCNVHEQRTRVWYQHRMYFFQETLCLMPINCKLRYFYSARIKLFTKLKVKMVAGWTPSPFILLSFARVSLPPSPLIALPCNGRH